MSRPILAATLCLALAACGETPREFEAPRNLDDACAILDQRPGYLNAMRKTERKWGIPVPVQMATIYQESKFIGDARTPIQWKLGVVPVARQSSAFGYSQALDGTWDEYVADQGARRARRDDIGDATDFMGWYMHQSAEELGIPKWDTTNQYLAYHDGRSGYRRGTFRRKPWLLRVANGLGTRAQSYDAQLRSCGKIRRRNAPPLVPAQVQERAEDAASG